MTNLTVTFKVEKNAKYGDFRVVKYSNNLWLNERDGNWSENKAKQIAKQYRKSSEKGFATMGDNI